MLIKKILVPLLLIFIFNSSCRKEEAPLSICFTGDVLLDRGVRNSIVRNGSVDFLFQDVKKLFKSSDAVVINLECPLTDNESPINKKYIFRGNADWSENLRNNGITHAALANNHTIDQGRIGLVDTYYNLQKSGLESVGYGKNKVEACQPTIIKKGNTKVALFNSVLVPLENWVCLDDESGICQASIDELLEKIKKLKQEDPSFHIVVILHWGAEYHLTPDPIQRREARKLIDSGADAIIGHHPHVIQEEEVYKGKNIFYSLGNFVFDQTKPHTDEGLIVKLVFDDQNINIKKRRVKIKDGRPKLLNP